MRLTVEFSSDREFEIPIHYNHFIQGFIYNSISPKLAQILHDQGFPLEKRKFKLFTYSRILGKFNSNDHKGTITFISPFRLIVSSVMNVFIQEIGEELLRKEILRIASNLVSVSSVEVSDFPINEEKIRIKMLSPVTIYSTLSSSSGRKKTYYYNPFEKEFSQLLSENAKKKFKAFYNKDSRGEIKLIGQNLSNKYEKIISYKGTVIKGWMGIYELSGDRELMKIVYDTGLGGKNPQGFGCFEILGRKNFKDGD